MARTALKVRRRNRIRRRLRTRISGTAAKPRLSVFRSNKQIYAQLIDDPQVFPARLVPDQALAQLLVDDPMNDLPIARAG